MVTPDRHVLPSRSRDHLAGICGTARQGTPRGTSGPLRCGASSRSTPGAWHSPGVPVLAQFTHTWMCGVTRSGQVSSSVVAISTPSRRAWCPGTSWACRRGRRGTSRAGSPGRRSRRCLRPPRSTRPHSKRRRMELRDERDHRCASNTWKIRRPPARPPCRRTGRRPDGTGLPVPTIPELPQLPAHGRVVAWVRPPRSPHRAARCGRGATGWGCAPLGHEHAHLVGDRRAVTPGRDSLTWFLPGLRGRRAGLTKSDLGRGSSRSGSFIASRHRASTA